MPHQRIADQPERNIGEYERHIDNTVIALLLEGESWPWSVHELAREIGHTNDTFDSIRRLTGHGLLHQHDEFVFPTRAARRAAEIEIASA